ncbi:hypothetical protein CCR75_000368 [Bremia lactucae]|uniref:Protein prenyltransferase alpha subunit repeat-containing protein 1 n=1 Tax=Bremia lactucae TaxID=4779 RepID=A0A976FPC2_BRELC|nr:hypothetical protein CCR75_000368 [Bremia lactucae]
MTTGESLLAQLKFLFEQDPLIDEVGLLFDIKQCDLSLENAFLLGNHKLGVAFEAGTILFQAARTQFHSLNALLQQELANNSMSEDSEHHAQLLHCTRAILLISADFYTAWNTRKSFVARGWLDAQDEVQFTNLVFTLHPKSIDTWAYRRWLAARICASQLKDDVMIFHKQQIEVCGRLAEQKPRNYHAWSFRHWIVSRLSHEMVCKELDEMENWCRMHVTDHSGWNHRQHTLNKLIKECLVSNEENLSWKLILAEYQFLSEIMTLYPTYEALWCHRRFIMQHLLDKVARNNDNLNLAYLNDSVSRVAKNVLVASRDETILSASWRKFLNDCSNYTSTSAISTIIHEIGIAWTCNNQYSRRYGAWCMMRLRAFFHRKQELGEMTLQILLIRELNSLGSFFQKVLMEKDGMRQDLWRSTLNCNYIC